MIGSVNIQSTQKLSSNTASTMNDVPQIEINSPSPNSSSNKSRSSVRDSSEMQNRNSPQRFGYDSYMKQQPEESVTQIKSPNTQRKPSKASTVISPVKQRETSEPKRSTATPINGNPTVTKAKVINPRHTSSSSEDQQHIAPPAPIKTSLIKEQPTTTMSAPVNSTQPLDKTNQQARLFIALFDYDPNAMSPNKDNEEELPFKEGQLIRVGRFPSEIVSVSNQVSFRFTVIKMPMAFILARPKTVERALFQVIWCLKFN